MIASTKTIGIFEVTTMWLADGQVLNFTVKDPKPENHKHQNSAVLVGGMSVVTGEYSATFAAGNSTKFTPRANTTPFDPDTVSTLTAVGRSYYVCVTGPVDKTLNHESQTFTETTSLTPGTLVVPTVDYVVNNEEKSMGAPYVVAQGDTLSIPNGALIGLFTPV